MPWDLPAHIVNAYYSIEANCVYVTDGLLRTLGLDLAATEPFGILGVLLAHEMSHALDGDSIVRDQGLDGSLPTAFPELREALSTQLGLTSTRYPGSMDIELVVDEALADLIGLRAALDALEQRGATDSDRCQFFANWAHLMRGRCSDEEGRRRLKVDPHPPLDVRCNLLADLPEFEAYCEASGVPLHEPPVATRRQVHAALREPSLILKGADTGH